MKNTIEYKNYYGTVECSIEDGVLFVKVIGVRSRISYEGSTVNELIANFHGAVDTYLNTCENEGVKPEKSFKGMFNVRISPELHMRAALYAIENHITLNRFVGDAIKAALIDKS